MKTYVYWIVLLIGLYLVANNADKINRVIATTGGTVLQGFAVLQGRNVKGVTV
jgi:ATP-dependent protease ClpP protease subunit